MYNRELLIMLLIRVLLCILKVPGEYSMQLLQEYFCRGEISTRRVQRED